MFRSFLFISFLAFIVSSVGYLLYKLGRGRVRVLEAHIDCTELKEEIKADKRIKDMFNEAYAIRRELNKNAKKGE